MTGQERATQNRAPVRRDDESLLVVNSEPDPAAPATETSFHGSHRQLTNDLDTNIQLLIEEAQNAPALGHSLVNTYRAQIPDYANLPQCTLEHDVLPNSIALIERLLSFILHGEPDEAFDDQLRDAAVRRFHQGVSLEALLQSYRLWAGIVWREIKGVVDREAPDEVDAGFEVVERVMTYVDHVSVVATQSFFAETAGIRMERYLLRGDILDALLGGHPPTGVVARRLALLEQELAGPHIVILIREEKVLPAGSQSFSAVLDTVRNSLKPGVSTLRLGVRSNEVIAIYPPREDESDSDVHAACAALAQGLGNSVVGIGRRRDGMAGICKGYGEASEAATIGAALGRYGRATYFRDVLLDHLGRASEYSRSLLEDTLVPLAQYDEERGATLVNTLRTFYETRFSLTRSAKLLHIHPNTVTYRLRRIHDLTGLDPANPDDLLLLSMGLKLGDLSN